MTVELNVHGLNGLKIPKVLRIGGGTQETFSKCELLFTLLLFPFTDENTEAQG